MPKISVVGAGNVGASGALYAAGNVRGDVTRIDRVEGVATGKGLDLLQAGAGEKDGWFIAGTAASAAEA
jgi:malate dehydrogenase